VLDEPTIGLHPRDNQILLDTLERLGDKGNTLVVVEHDEETIRRADHVIDLGPGAGTRGGRVVGQGRVDDLIAAGESLTGRFLATPLASSTRGAARCSRTRCGARGRARPSAQPARRRRPYPTGPPGGDLWRLRVGQVDAGA
jgi:excinuclease UvrABC ATPase subunit